MNARNILSKKVHAFEEQSDRTFASGCGLRLERWGERATDLRQSLKKAGTDNWPTYVEMWPHDSVSDYGVELCRRCFRDMR